MIELLSYFVLGWLLYRLVSAWVTLQEIKSAVGEAVERNMIGAAVDQQILVARMEPVQQGEHTVVLAYNHNNNKFLGQAATQDQVESLLKEKYPESKKSQKVSGKETAKSQKNVNQTYEDIYRLFESGNYLIAAEAKKKADSIHGNKYWTPQLLYIEAISLVKQQNDSLALSTLIYIETNFPDNEMAEKVKTLKDVISRRKEI